jgi:hypothetical protein
VKRPGARVTLLAGLVMLLVTPSAVRGQPVTLPGPAADCQVVDRAFPDVSAPDGTVVVPVIIHYMMLKLDSVPRGARFNADDNHVAEVLATAPQLEGLFAAPATGVPRKQRNVNHVWKPFGVRLGLVRVERCDFTWADVSKVPVPGPAATDLARFRALARRFNTPGFNGLNVYQWPKIDGSAGAYGFTPRADGASPGPGAVWYHVPSLVDSDPGPAPNPPPRVLLLAHEIGHFFTLKHTCTFSSEPGLPDCPEPGSSGKLMSAFADGTGLNECERRKARQGVQKVMQGTPIATEEEITCRVPVR